MKKIQDELIRIIKQITLPTQNPVDTLIGIIPMSKEAAYRRLRGTIDFSFEEVVKISREFNISLDKMIHERNEEELFAMKIRDLAGVGDPIESYCQSLKELAVAVNTMKKYQNPMMSVATNMLLPFSYLYKYETMSKLRLFRWMLQNEGEFNPLKMRDIIVGSEVQLAGKNLAKEMEGLGANYICHQDLFLEYIRDVKYFQDIELLSNDEVMEIQDEAYRFLEELEYDVIKGVSRTGAPLLFYICNFNLGVTYILFTSDDSDSVVTPQFGLGFYLFENQRVTGKVKLWNNTLKKNSTLISVCGEKYRFEFFQKQREFVSLLSEPSIKI